MPEKKKARWEENRELIQQNQLTFGDLNDKYDDLKSLTAKLVDAHCTFVEQVKTSNRASLGRRPNLVLKHVAELKQMLLNLDGMDNAEEPPEPITVPNNDEE